MLFIVYVGNKGSNVGVGIGTGKPEHRTEPVKKNRKKNRLTKKVNEPDRNRTEPVPTGFDSGFTSLRTGPDRTGPVIYFIFIFLQNFKI